MKIAIDLTQIPADKTGVGIYALNLVREMCKLNNLPGKFHFIFFVQDDDQEFMHLLKKSIQSTIIPVNSKTFRKLPLRFFFEQVLLPRKCRKLNADLIFSLHYTMPCFSSIKRVVMIPDMTFYLFPQMHQKIKRLYFKSLIPVSIRKSSALITISQSTKNDILERFKHLPPDKINVTPLGVDIFKEIEPTGDRDEILKKYGLTTAQYFLYVGTLEPRKNIVNIIHAFHHLRQTDPKYNNKYKLVIAGKKGWFYNEIFKTVENLHLEESVVFTGYISEEEKQVLLLNAFLFVYPSFYEGFGIPILEAMGSGLPVITGNTSSLPEVAGDAALLINPNYRQQISSEMLKLLSDRALYEQLAEKGLEQAKKFTWENTARKTLALLEKLNETTEYTENTETK